MAVSLLRRDKQEEQKERYEPIPGSLPGSREAPTREEEYARVPFEQPETAGDRAREGPLTTSPTTGSPSAATPPAAKSAQLERIEHVLEEELGEVYFQMNEGQRRMFREEGEKTARAIDQLITSAKATAQKLLHLIRRWLMLIPGLNKFFLEQEAKIKTDKVMALAEDRKS